MKFCKYKYSTKDQETLCIKAEYFDNNKKREQEIYKGDHQQTTLDIIFE